MNTQQTATPITLNIPADALAALPSEGRISVETVEGVTLRGAWYSEVTSEWHGWIAERETYATVAAQYVAAVTVDGERRQVLTTEESAETVSRYYTAEATRAAGRQIAARAREAAERVEDGLLDSAEELLEEALEELRARRAGEAAHLTA